MFGFNCVGHKHKGFNLDYFQLVSTGYFIGANLLRDTGCAISVASITSCAVTFIMFTSQDARGLTVFVPGPD